MADFVLPWAYGATLRTPTATERAGGFACGPADKPLFDFLFNSLQAEVGHVIDYAGLIGSNGDMQQLRKAIQQLIFSATGAGDTSQFVLMSQARARLPFFPEVQSSDGKINVFSPTGGSVQVPGSVVFQHRGIFPLSTSDYAEAARTFTTAASKTYHVRWDPTNGFRLRDLAGGTYNPDALPETDPAFDSTYDDMLVARVVTNASNIATITPLANKHDLSEYLIWSGPMTTNTGNNGARRTFTSTFNWARTPKLATSLLRMDYGQESITDFDFRIHPLTAEIGIGGSVFVGADDYLNRYGTSCVVMIDNATTVDIGVDLRG